MQKINVQRNTSTLIIGVYEGPPAQRTLHKTNLLLVKHESKCTFFFCSCIYTLLYVCGLCHPWIFQSRKEASVLTVLQVTLVNYCVDHTAHKNVLSNSWHDLICALSDIWTLKMGIRAQRFTFHINLNLSRSVQPLQRCSSWGWFCPCRDLGGFAQPSPSLC